MVSVVDSWRNGYSGCFKCPGMLITANEMNFEPKFHHHKPESAWFAISHRFPHSNVSSILQGKIKGYPVWGDPNRIEPFLNKNAPPPAASPSIVNSKALGNCYPSHSRVSAFVAPLDLVILLLPQVYLFQSYKSWKDDQHLGPLWFIMCVFLNIGAWSLLWFWSLGRSINEHVKLLRNVLYYHLLYQKALNGFKFLNLRRFCCAGKDFVNYCRDSISMHAVAVLTIPLDIFFCEQFLSSRSTKINEISQYQSC